MKKVSIINRLILLATCHLAGYQIISGIEGYNLWTTICYTVAFGTLVLACLLMIIFGLDILKNVMVVGAATLVPLGLSMGLISTHVPELERAYMVFAVVGLISVVATRVISPGRDAAIAITVVHGSAGLILFVLPIALVITGVSPIRFALVGVGGGVVGILGLLLAFMRLGRPILAKDAIYRGLPTVLLLVTALFVLGTHRSGA